MNNKTSVTTRLAAWLFLIQAVAIGVIYFMRLDGPILNIPAVHERVEALRAQANLDAVWTKFNKDQQVWGYVDRHSIVPGDSFNLMLSTKPGSKPFTGVVQISRLTWKDDESQREWAWESDQQTIDAQPLVNTAASVGAGWTVTDVVSGTEKWKTGYYIVDIIGDDGKHQDNVAAIIVRPTKRTGDILVKVSTNTFQAYNRWGGSSFYNSALFNDKAPMVSFDRPTYPAFEDYETYFVAWMEKYAQEKGLEVGYIGDFDLHSDPAIMDGYKLFVSQGHDEYWSKEMFDAVENRIFKQGKNTLFLGANTAYWQVRYMDVSQAPGGPNLGRQMVAYKEKYDPIAARFPSEEKALPYLTNMFRYKARRPETMLVGVAYQSYFEPTDESGLFDYKIVDTTLPFFAGVNWKAGDLIKGVVGYEWDNRDPERDGKRLWDPMTSMNAEIPASKLKVLFTSEPVDAEGHKGLAEAVYWESPAGAKVFSSGAIRWDWGFGKDGITDDEFVKFNENLFDYFRK